jgi:hypothetical protein
MKKMPRDPELTPEQIRTLMRIRTQPPVSVTIQPWDAWVAVAVIQYGTRNPYISQTQREQATVVALILQHAIAAVSPLAAELLNDGWNKALDYREPQPAQLEPPQPERPPLHPALYEPGLMEAAMLHDISQTMRLTLLAGIQDVQRQRGQEEIADEPTIADLEAWAHQLPKFEIMKAFANIVEGLMDLHTETCSLLEERTGQSCKGE